MWIVLVKFLPWVICILWPSQSVLLLLSKTFLPDMWRTRSTKTFFQCSRFGDVLRKVIKGKYKKSSRGFDRSQTLPLISLQNIKETQEFQFRQLRIICVNSNRRKPGVDSTDRQSTLIHYWERVAPWNAYDALIALMVSNVCQSESLIWKNLWHQLCQRFASKNWVDLQI